MKKKKPKRVLFYCRPCDWVWFSTTKAEWVTCSRCDRKRPREERLIKDIDAFMKKQLKEMKIKKARESTGHEHIKTTNRRVDKID